MDKSFELTELTRREKQHEQDRVDFNNEMAGNETGRSARFGIAQHRTIKEEEKEKRKRTALENLLQSTAYRTVWTNTISALNSADQAVYDTLIQANDELSHSVKSHQSLLDRAMTLPNGEKAFRDENGGVYNAMGEKLDSQIYMIEWQASHPTWDAYQDSKQKLEQAEDRYDQVRDHELRLADIREDIEDNNNPLSIDALEKLSTEITAIHADVSPMIDNKPELEVTYVNPVIVPDLKL